MWLRPLQDKDNDTDNDDRRQKHTNEGQRTTETDPSKRLNERKRQKAKKMDGNGKKTRNLRTMVKKDRLSRLKALVTFLPCDRILAVETST
jgi:hypothetical protein